MTAKMLRRRLGKDGPEVTAPGLGLMSLSMGYGKPGNDEERLAFLDRAWELGCRTWDTADAYGDNEDLVGKWFRLHPERRQDIFLCSKFGFVKGGLDSSPGHCREACEKSLDRLGVNHIDLYYIHRVDGKTPIEKTMEELARLKSEGKINYIGISAASSATIRRACYIAPVTAVQVEYSPWATDIENEVGTHLLQTCRELGIAIVAYAPLGRGFLTGQIKSPDDFEKGDVRKGLPRFSKENFAKNLAIVDNFRSMAAKKGCKPGQLALAWVMAQGEDFIPIPGTKNIKYLEENVGGAEVVLSEAEEKEIRTWVANVEGETKTPGNVLDYGDTPHL